MKLGSSTIGRFALGLIASSGAALLFAGSAMAASPVSVTDNDQTANVITQTVDETSTTVTTKTETQSDAKAAGLITAPTDGSGNGPIAPTQATVGTPSESAPAAPTSTAPSIDAVVPVNQVVAPTGSEPVPAVVGPTSLPVVPVVLSAEVLHRAALTTISEPQTPVQLAVATTASTSSPAQPTAPKSNGLLTTLTTGLTATTVPSFLLSLLSAVGQPHASTLPLLLTVVVILFTLVSLSYGFMLRRSGYTTAARSDVAPFTFATPLFFLMDYWNSRLPIVFFGGVRDQKPVYVMSNNVYQERR